MTRTLADYHRHAAIYRPLAFVMTGAAGVALLVGWLQPTAWLLAVLLAAILATVWLFAVVRCSRRGCGRPRAALRRGRAADRLTRVLRPDTIELGLGAVLPAVFEIGEECELLVGARGLDPTEPTSSLSRRERPGSRQISWAATLYSSSRPARSSGMISVAMRRRTPTSDASGRTVEKSVNPSAW